MESYNHGVGVQWLSDC